MIHINNVGHFAPMQEEFASMKCIPARDIWGNQVRISIPIFLSPIPSSHSSRTRRGLCEFSPLALFCNVVVQPCIGLKYKKTLAPQPCKAFEDERVFGLNLGGNGRWWGWIRRGPQGKGGTLQPRPVRMQARAREAEAKRGEEQEGEEQQGARLHF